MKSEKVGMRSKPVKKTSAAAAKPVKKLGKALPSSAATAKMVNGLPVWKPTVIPLAEVEVLAAAALKKIKASRSMPPNTKALRLARAAELLEKARTRWNGLSKAGVSWLKHAHEPPMPYDEEAIKAVMQ